MKLRFRSWQMQDPATGSLIWANVSQINFWSVGDGDSVDLLVNMPRQKPISFQEAFELHVRTDHAIRNGTDEARFDQWLRSGDLLSFVQASGYHIVLKPNDFEPEGFIPNVSRLRFRNFVYITNKGAPVIHDMADENMLADELYAEIQSAPHHLAPVNFQTGMMTYLNHTARLYDEEDGVSKVLDLVKLGPVKVLAEFYGQRILIEPHEIEWAEGQGGRSKAS